MAFPVLTALLAMTLAQSQPAPPRPGPVANAALVAELAQLDTDLFTAAFDSCDVDRVASLIADDFEFYHDKDGLSYTTREAFLADLNCLDREASGARFTRRLVPASLETFQIGDDYALQTGRHQFYQVQDTAPDILREVAQFISLWRLEDGVWRLTRVISFDHRVPGAEGGQ